MGRPMTEKGFTKRTNAIIAKYAKLNAVEWSWLANLSKCEAELQDIGGGLICSIDDAEYYGYFNAMPEIDGYTIPTHTRETLGIFEASIEAYRDELLRAYSAKIKKGNDKMRNPKQANEHETRDLYLYLVNTQAEYLQGKVIVENLARKIAAGKYDAEKAPKAFLNLITAAMKSRDYKIVYGEFSHSVADRKAAAVELLDYFHGDIEETAADLIGPEFVAVDVCNWDHDMYGNPTAQHHVYTSTSDGGRVRLITNRKCRRAQVGYGDWLDSCPEALKKAGIMPEWYSRKSVTGSRSEDSLIANYARRPIEFGVTK